MAVKALIFGLDHIVLKSGSFTDEINSALAEMFDFIRTQGIKPILLGNRDWVNTDEETGVETDIKTSLIERFGELTIYITTVDNIPPKPTSDCLSKILELESLQRYEVLFIGNSVMDFRTSVNSKVLFLNAIWEPQQIEYGFTVQSPLELIEYLKTYVLRDHLWFFKIDHPLSLRSLAPFSTYKEEYRGYSSIARKAAKEGGAERAFFLHALITSLYLSEYIKDVNYITCAPGHASGYGNAVMDEALSILGKCFKTRYIPDLIARHTTAAKSQYVRIRGRKPSPLSQLNSIHLNARPLKAPGNRYANKLRLNGKVILLIDDFCTSGYTLEAARIYLEKAGAIVKSATWLKTINTNFEKIDTTKRFDPYAPNLFQEADITLTHLDYSHHITDRHAAKELSERLELYL